MLLWYGRGCGEYAALWVPDLDELLASGLWLLAKTGLLSGPAGNPIEPEASGQEPAALFRVSAKFRQTIYNKALVPAFEKTK
jgi:hypothetical protein